MAFHRCVYVRDFSMHRTDGNVFPEKHNKTNGLK